jgi:hypothetical protein
MRNRKNYVMTSAATLTQSGLLAVLLRRQRYKVIELARRRARREQARAALRSTLKLAVGARSRQHRWSTIPPGL